MPDDALMASKMNLGPGRKQPLMRDSIIPPNNPFGHGGQMQAMNYPHYLPEDHPHKEFASKPKGMRVIAEERGYTADPSGNPLIGDCAQCKARRARKVKIEDSRNVDTDSEESDSEEEDNRSNTCCLWQLLFTQEDFQMQKCLIQQVSVFVRAFLIRVNHTQSGY